jgi:anti-sigma regulatory factor (Ser/Thr protein kinase)
VQKSLLPDAVPRFVHLDIAVTYEPAESVSGDLYDIIKLNDHTTAFLVFDVSGQGVPAALVASIARMLFTESIKDGRSPSEIFYEVNERLTAHSPPHFYLTAFLGFFDSLNNTLVYSKAGHVPPLLYHESSGEVEWLTGRGSFIGHPALKDMAVYNDEKLVLGNYDKILLYTDGVIESWNADEELFGRQRLYDAVKQYGTRPVHAFVEGISRTNAAFRDPVPLHDDVTIVGIQLGCPEKLISEAGMRKSEYPEVKVIYTYEEIDAVCAAILSELDRHGYPNAFFYWAKLCIYEMVSNALRHGNRFEADKMVIILYTVTCQAFSISVIDEGDGFDYGNIPDPRGSDYIYKPNGRGLFIIRHYMDEVAFNEKGNRIKATKYRFPLGKGGTYGCQ